MSSCRLTYTEPRCLQLFGTRVVQKSILLSQSVGFTSRFSLKAENMNSIRSSSFHSGVSVDRDIFHTLAGGANARQLRASSVRQRNPTPGVTRSAKRSSIEREDKYQADQP